MKHGRNSRLLMQCFFVFIFILFLPAWKISAQETGKDMGDISLGDLLNLGDVLVTATKNPMALKKAPAIATIITDKEIRNMGARDIMDVLGIVPGITVSKSGGTGFIVSIRGIGTPTSEKCLFLIDGHKMNNNYYGEWSLWVFDNLMLENIKKIEIIRGPGSALYGTNAFTGVINVITKTAEDINGQQISISRGSFSTWHSNGLFSYKHNDFKISGHVDYFDTDGQDLLIEEDGWAGKPGGLSPGYTHPFEKKWDWGLKIKYKDFTLSSRIIDKEKSPYIGNVLILNNRTLFKLTNFWGDLNYEKQITDNLDISAKIYGNYYRFDTLYEMRPQGFTNGNDNGMLGNPMSKNSNLGGEFTANYALGTHLITKGLVYENARQFDVKVFDNLTNGLFGEMVEVQMFTKNINRDIWAVYLQDVWEITDYDSLTMGLRYDRYSDFGGTVNPRLGYVHEFGFDLVLKLLYGSAFRAPNFTEVYAVNNPVKKGNPDLKPEKISTYEVGLEFPFLKNWTFGLVYFHNNIEDLIKMEPVSAPGVPTHYINTDGTTQVDGFEAKIKFTFLKDKYGYISCSYQDGDDEKGFTIPNMPHWKANAGLNYGLSKYLNANINVSWVGERTRDERDTREELGSDTLVDLTVIAKNFYKGFEIRGSVYNLFDEDYRDPADMRVPNDFPYHKRMFLVETRYKF